MIAATYTLFGAGILQEWLAAAAALVYLMGQSEAKRLRVSVWVATTGLVCLVLTLVLRYVQWDVVPLTTGADNLLLFTVLATATAISVSCTTRNRSLLTFYLPPLAVLGALCAALAFKDFSKAPNAMNVSQALLIVHVGLAFLAYALFFIASLTSLAYVFQSRRLKSRKTTGLFQKLPPLDTLDRTLHNLIKVGYPLFVITLLMGLGWARFASHALTATWWFSPKIMFSAAMVIFYAASFHSRSMGLLRGPKLAYFVFVGYALLIAVYLLLELLRLTNYNFLVQP